MGKRRQEDTPARSLADFEGAWRIRRSMEFHDGSSAVFEGTAVWRPDPAGLAYLEEGTLHMPDQVPMVATRRYLWQPDLSVWFDDGRYFHTVPATGGHTDHWCDPDHYGVTYRFTDWPTFEVEWRVVGPRKDYRMRSSYTRA